MPTFEQHVAALGRAKAAGDTAAVREILGRIQASEREAAEPTKGMGGLEKLAANLGAGIDTTVQGLSQLVGAGPDDAELKESRALKQHLADKTTGGTLTQIVGEVLPTVPLGVGAGMAATRLAPAAMASRAAPFVQGGLEGAAIGASAPTTSDESKLLNVGAGVAGGVAAPAVVRAAGGLTRAAGRGAANILERPAAALEQATGVNIGATERGARRALSRTLEREGIDLPRASQQRYRPHPFLNEPPTASMVTQDERIAALERASRAASPDEWVGKDRALSEARHEMLDQGLDTQQRAGQLIDEANRVGSEVPQAYAAAVPRRWNPEMDKFYAKLQQAKQSAPYHGSPPVKAAIDYLENTMERAGTVTPELLHKMRQTLRGGLKGVPGLGDEATRAAAKEPYIHGIANEMDEILDKATKGKFGQWKDDYSTAMTRAERAKADVNIRNVFEDQAGVNRVPSTSLDGAPDITPHKLRRAINQFGTLTRGPKKGQDVLSTGSRDVAEGVLRDLEAQAILQRVKKSGTGLGGSNTAMDLSQILGSELLLPGGGVMAAVGARGRDVINEQHKRLLAELLQDPQRLRQFIQAQMLRAGPQAPMALPPGLAGPMGALPMLAAPQE